METKPCPFCGKEMTRREKWSVGEGKAQHDEYAIVCDNCGAFGPNDLGWSGAEEMWNLRRPMDTAEVDAARLRAVNAQLVEAVESLLQDVPDSSQWPIDGVVVALKPETIRKAGDALIAGWHSRPDNKVALAAARDADAV